jgi:hypothetical protein
LLKQKKTVKDQISTQAVNSEWFEMPDAQLRFGIDGRILQDDNDVIALPPSNIELLRVIPSMAIVGG